MKTEDRAKAGVYFRKAQRFSVAATANASERHWDPAVANAINSVINLVDALCVHYRGHRNSGDTHHDALPLLRSVDEIEPGARSQLERHLGALLSTKTLAQYEGRLLTAADADSALSHMERAFRAARELPPVKAWEAHA